jgi:glycosyltransferase involved in cell wall biosynthesis
MTAMTAVIVDAFHRHRAVRSFNWSRGKELRGWRWKLARGWGAFASIVRLLLGGRARHAVLYYPVSSGLGLYYDLAIASVARLLGYHLVLHHHTYAYIMQRDRRVAWLDRLVSSTGAHAVHCDLMREDFARTYKTSAKFLIVPPTIVSQRDKTEGPAPLPEGDFTIGFLSYISIAKGIDDAIATFEKLASLGRRVRFLIAGPCRGDEEESLLQGVQARWPGRVEYLGPVYGRDKERFFSRIHAFLLPTRNESWGIVLNESLAAGRPVIARSRGCVPWIVQHGCGLCVPPDADFIADAVKQISVWMDSPASFQAAQEAAHKRSIELNEDAEHQLPAFVESVFAMGRL